MHGCKQDDDEVREMIAKEREEERACMMFLRDQPSPANLFIRGVTTRGGKHTQPSPQSKKSDTSSDPDVVELEGRNLRPIN